MRSVLPLLLIAAPAGAQIAPRGPLPSTWRPADPFGETRPPPSSYARNVRDIRDRVEDAKDGGAISRREARRLDREARRLGALAERWGENGLSGAERRQLDGLAASLRGVVDRPRATAGPPGR